jgi:hypothetical protein
MEPEEPWGQDAPIDERFNEVVEQTRAVKATFVDKQSDWYRKHRLFPFVLFRGAGIITIVLSVALPAIAAIQRDAFPKKDVVLGIMSVAIAGLTSLSAFYRWERTWQSRTLTFFAIEAYSAKWELEVANARLLVDSADRLKHVYAATNDLITNVTNVCASESEGFFRGMQFPQAEHPK